MVGATSNWTKLLVILRASLCSVKFKIYFKDELCRLSCGLLFINLWLLCCWFVWCGDSNYILTSIFFSVFLYIHKKSLIVMIFFTLFRVYFYILCRCKHRIHADLKKSFIAIEQPNQNSGNYFVLLIPE